ncbi:MAG: hypothetical protein LC791_06840 [Acidobacteria bacterium]|nr:hypothetical protein [Acidobacteriota bacterium]
MTVIKTRSRKHSEDIRRYEITEQGVVVGERFHDYEGIIGGLPQRRRSSRPTQTGLTDQEGAVFAGLVELQQGSAHRAAAGGAGTRTEAAG